MFDSPQKAEDFISSLSQKKTYAAALQGKGRNSGHYLSGPAGGAWWPGVEAVPPAQEGMMARWTWMLVEPVFAFSYLLSPPEILFLFIRYNGLFAGKTNTPFFFFGGD